MSDNELIAEFMNQDHLKRRLQSYLHDGYTKEQFYASLSFHDSWDWLMPVVEKIETLGYYTNIFKDEDGQQTAILHPVPSYRRDENSMIVPNDPMRGNKSKIETAYKAVVEFIKWYNTEKLKHKQS